MTAANADYACEFARYDEDGEVMFECKRTDTDLLVLHGDEVRVCPTHRSWLPAMGIQIDSPEAGR